VRLRMVWLLVALAMLAACASPPAGPAARGRKVRIGFSMDSLQEERWQRDRDLFVARARELGADVIVQAASGDDYLQMAQAENMLTRGVDVLVIVPHDTGAMGPIVEKAHAAGAKVIAYDRLITFADVDFYVTFDSQRIGELQARYLTELVPRGRYVYIGGAPTDNNAYLLWRGAMQVLQPLRAAGEIELVLDEMTRDWQPENARHLANQALAKAGGPVDAIIAANDALAGGVIEALYAHNLAGTVAVAGQDADLAALQRIVARTQTMTVYKPIRQLAGKAAEAAIALARGEQPRANDFMYNGKSQIPSQVLQPIAIDNLNWLDTVVRDGFHREEDILGIK